MTPEEMYQALESGLSMFRNTKSGKVYSVDPSQRDVLEFQNACLICFPEQPHPRTRGRGWVFISPKNLEPITA